MKTRIAVAVILLPLAAAIIFFAPFWVFGAAVGAIAAGSAWELLRCSEAGAPRRILIYTAAAAFAIPFQLSLGMGTDGTPVIVLLLTLLIFGELMASFKGGRTMELETVAMVLLAGVVLPVLLSSLVRLGLREGTGKVYETLPIILALACDSGAYFTGLLFGRHKLAPNISPHKTLEGSIGGFAAGIGLALLYGLVLSAAGFEVRFLVLLCYGFLGSLFSQMGDLSFSAIKRLCGVKDYGSLIPGHGGMLDRFDSLLLTAPVIEALVLWVPVFIKR
jgi:phosphatidate cytidylyltransferase